MCVQNIITIVILTGAKAYAVQAQFKVQKNTFYDYYDKLVTWLAFCHTFPRGEQKQPWYLNSHREASSSCVVKGMQPLYLLMRKKEKKGKSPYKYHRKSSQVNIDIAIVSRAIRMRARHQSSHSTSEDVRGGLIPW